MRTELNAMIKNDDNYKDEGEDNGNNEDKGNKGNDNENEMKSYNESDSENDSNGNNYSENSVYWCFDEASEYKGWVIKLDLTTPVKF